MNYKRNSQEIRYTKAYIMFGKRYRDFTAEEKREYDRARQRISRENRSKKEGKR